MNINGMFEDDFYDGKSQFCIFKLQYPVLEMGFMMLNNVCFFAWIKSCEDIKEHEDNITVIGVTLMENLSQKESNLLFNLIVLFFQYFDNILILIIVVSGLNKVDLYHVLCLFIFVAFLVRPK